MNPFLTCSSAPHRLHRSSIASLRRTYHRRRIWAIYARLKPCCEELASAAGVHQGYLTEWLAQQTASRYLTYDSATQQFTLPPEQAMMLAIEDSPVAIGRPP